MATAAVDQFDDTNHKAIEIYQPDAQVGEMRLWRPPEKVLAEAQQAAVALKRVIDTSAIKPVKFGQSEHLRHEHWGTLGHFFGYCTKIESTKYVEFPSDDGTIRGFEASALLLNERTGAVVGRVEAMCLDEEENWGEVAEYEWQNGKRVEVGTKMKPLFQLRSMAETRASAKAFRMKLGWVAVLAGYSQTPAEEIHDQTMQPEKSREEFPDQLKRKPVQAAPVEKPITPAYQAPVRRETQRPATEKVISDGQARRFYATWKGADKTKAMVIEYLQGTFGIKDDRAIPVSRYEEACAWATRRN